MRFLLIVNSLSFYWVPYQKFLYVQLQNCSVSLLSPHLTVYYRHVSMARDRVGPPQKKKKNKKKKIKTGEKYERYVFLFKHSMDI